MHWMHCPSYPSISRQTLADSIIIITNFIKRSVQTAATWCHHARFLLVCTFAALVSEAAQNSTGQGSWVLDKVQKKVVIMIMSLIHDVTIKLWMYQYYETEITIYESSFIISLVIDSISDVLLKTWNWVKPVPVSKCHVMEEYSAQRVLKIERSFSISCFQTNLD